MKLALFEGSQAEAVIHLFGRVFADSEGAEEGQLIANLVSDLIATTDKKDLVGCVACSDDRIVGGIFFSRFTVPNGDLAFILSPVAIASDMQGRGVGQKLIRYGLEHMRSMQVSLVLTYGDPAFYGKTGFEVISESLVPAPFKLSHPEGWLAQSLDGKSIEVMRGETQCVSALSDPSYW